MKINRIYVLILLLFVGIISVLIFQFYSSRVNFNKIEEIDNTYDLFQQTHQVIDEELLRLNNSLSFSYDVLNKNTKQLIEISETPNFSNEIDDLLKEKITLIEEFKSKHAIYRNSIKTITFLAKKLEDKDLSVFNLVYTVLDYNLSPSEKLLSSLNLIINELNAKKDKLNSDDSENVELILYHANTIVDLKKKNIEILNALNNIPLTYSTNKIRSNQIQEIKTTNKSKNQLILGSILIIIISFGVLIGLLYRSLKRRDQLKELNLSLDEKVKDRTKLLDQRNEEILSSIRYAQRIQEAIQPPVKKLKNLFEGIFLIYQPKDIVSGDFFWHTQNGDSIYICVADCTGHGVPGGFLSMLCQNTLNDAVAHLKLKDTAEILSFVNNHITQHLSTSEDSSMQDGMDIGLLRIDKKLEEVHFSGAKNNLLINADNLTLKVCKGDRHSIGESLDYQFSKSVFKMSEIYSLYLTSDGYIDQIGGERNKKIGSKRFRNLITENLNQPFDYQKEFFTNFISNWISSGLEEQLDDITLLGLKFKNNK